MIKVNDKAKMIRADRLISITCLKEEGGLALYYHFSLDREPGIKELRVEAGNEKEVESMIGLYANAELFESEVTEFFGLVFKGNPSSGKRLFLEER